jgi:hypothetical protein
MIALPDNYQELIAETLREMAASNARTIAAALQSYQQRQPGGFTEDLVGKKTPAPITVTQGGPHGGGPGNFNPIPHATKMGKR